MTFQRVSLLVPTRGRLERLKTFLASWDATVTDADSAELVFRVDSDDKETLSFLLDRAEASQALNRIHVGPRLNGYRSIPQFLEDMRQIATGDVFMLGNDDMVLVTPDWPAKLLAVANQYPDGIFVLGCDVQNAKNFVFPIVSRLAVDAMGHIMDPRLYWGDVYLRDVFAAFDRAIRFHDMQVDHQWAGREKDQTFREEDQDNPANWSEDYWAKHGEVVREAIDKLLPLWQAVKVTA